MKWMEREIERERPFNFLSYNLKNPKTFWSSLSAAVLDSGDVPDPPLEVGVGIGLHEGVNGANSTAWCSVNVGSGDVGVSGKGWCGTLATLGSGLWGCRLGGLATIAEGGSWK